MPAVENPASAGTLERGVRLRGGWAARVRFTSAADGDLRVTRAATVLAAARAAVLDRPWSWLHQEHGDGVVTVGAPGAAAGSSADALITDVPGAPLAIHTADCAPLALLSPEGVVGAVHAGWRGLASGVVEGTVAHMREAGASSLSAVLGPCIRPECYEFGSEELDRMVDLFGPAVRGRTATGAPALDVPAAVRAALDRATGAAGMPRAALDDVGACTACDARFFSHRARQDEGRQAMLVWLEEAGRHGAER